METDPYLDAGVRGHIVKMAKRYVRSVAGADMADLTQEGYVVFYHCRRKYVGVEPTRRRDGELRRFLPEHPDREAIRHFMTLFKTALQNRLLTLVQKQSASMELHIQDVAAEEATLEEAWNSVLPVEEEVATVSLLLTNAPKEIKQLFSLLVDDALLLSGRRRYGKRGLRKRESNNRYWCRLLGLPIGTDLSGQVESYFLRNG